jgi:hypothetical protein
MKKKRRKRTWNMQPGWFRGQNTKSIEAIGAQVREEEQCFLKIQNLAGVNRIEAMNIFRASGCDPALALEAAGKLHGVDC